MRQIWIITGLLLALTGCGERAAEHMAAAPAMVAGAPAQEADKAVADAAPAAPRTLAYEHSLTLDEAEDQVPVLYQKTQQLCQSMPSGACTLLDARLNTGENANASLRLRVLPAQVKPLLSALRTLGKVNSQSTSVEDLAAPMQDNAKKIAMLTAYRSQLEGLRTQANRDVEAAIKIARELAQVQNELESVSGNLAHLEKRVNTEIVNLSIQSHSSAPFTAPIRAALREFMSNLAQGLASAITFLAYAVPWSLVLGLLGWGLRKLWLKVRRRKAVPAP